MKVTMYRANDGSLHDTQKACDVKNVELRTVPLVEEFVNGLKPTDFINGRDASITEGFWLDLADLPRFIVDNSEALRTLLNKAVTPLGRPRKNAGEQKEKAPRKPRTPRAPKASETPPAPNQPAATGSDPVEDALAGLGE